MNKKVAGMPRQNSHTPVSVSTAFPWLK